MCFVSHHVFLPLFVTYSIRELDRCCLQLTCSRDVNVVLLERPPLSEVGGTGVCGFAGYAKLLFTSSCCASGSDRNSISWMALAQAVIPVPKMLTSIPVVFSLSFGKAKPRFPEP